MKFSMPADPYDKVKMYKAMLVRVKEARELVASQMDMVSRAAAGQDARKIYKVHKKLHLQELCLIDQERRLRERIALHQIGASMESCRAVE
jgi:hypothetical protein